MHEDNWQKPHALYRYFDPVGTLLYIGCSLEPFSRLQVHHTIQDWWRDIATVKIEWHPDWYAARRAEAVAIVAEVPRYNRLRISPDQVATTIRARRDRLPRGDGVHCPKCGEPKPRPKATYCAKCQAAYQRARRLKKSLESPNLS